MSATTRTPAAPVAAATETEAGEQRLVLRAVGWAAFSAIDDALRRRRDVRLIYREGTLTFMVKSREHEVLAERLGYFVAWLAVGLNRPCEPCGQMTLRRMDLDAGLEGDKTFYLGANAEKMRGAKRIDLEVDPPPDLAIEVEVTHPADEALATYARLGVPEVWRYDAGRSSLTFLRLSEGRHYAESPGSSFFPSLTALQVTEQLQLAADLGTTQWLTRLVEWVRLTQLP